MSLMDQLIDVVASQVSQPAAHKTGMSEGTAAQLAPMAMAVLMNALKKNASSAEGADALASALDRHDGSLLNRLDQVGDDATLSDGQNILRHILGGKQAQTEQTLAKAAGVDQAHRTLCLRRRLWCWRAWGALSANRIWIPRAWPAS